MTVRISATDWIEGGNTADDAVEIAQAFVDHGADGIDVSTGQVTKEEKPAFGRSYQTPSPTGSGRRSPHRQESP